MTHSGSEKNRERGTEKDESSSYTGWTERAVIQFQSWPKQGLGLNHINMQVMLQLHIITRARKKKSVLPRLVVK